MTRNLAYFLAVVTLFLIATLVFGFELEGWQKALVILLLGWLLLMELLERKKIEAERHAVMVLFRTEKGKTLIEKIARYKGFWRIFGSLGIVIGYLGMAAFFILIIYNFYLVYIDQVSLPEGTSRGAQFLIPGVTVPLYWIVGLIIVLVVHEFAHGIIAVSQGVPIRNLGVILFTIIPIGAFVEPDEESLKKRSNMTKLRVYAAGSFTNLVVALVTAVFMVAFTAFFLGPLHIVDVVEESPAHGVLESGMEIQSINGVEFSPRGDTADLGKFMNITQAINPGDEVTFVTDEGTFTLTAAKKDGGGFIGIQVSIFVSKYKQYIYAILSSIALLNFLLGIMNLGPILFIVAATDGHHMLRLLLTKFMNETSADKVTTFVSLSMMVLIAYMLIVPAPGSVGG